MYNVYQVDDDKLIMNELTNTVPWLDNGFTVVGGQTNPLLAFEEISFLKPDVVFCDLKMPVMDGNELISKLREVGVDCEFVMLSAYDSFENVRAFFQQSGFDYILKPVDQDDIQMVLEKLSVKLEATHPQVVEDVLTENDGFNKLVKYIQEHFDEKITLDMLSEKFGFTRNYICGLFTRYCNKSLTRYLTELRMQKAKELLSDKTILIKDVAIQCGYGEYFNFFKVFKNYYGVSPKDMQES